MQLLVKAVGGGGRDGREAQQECDAKTSTGHLLRFRMNYIQIHRIMVCFNLYLLIQAKPQFVQQLDGREVVGIHNRGDLRLTEYQVSMLQYGVGRFPRVALAAIFGQESKSEIGIGQ